MKQLSGKSRGFTLLEVLLAVGVLMFGSMGVMALFAIASESHRAAVEQTEAALAAETILADFQSLCTPAWLEDLLEQQGEFPVKLVDQEEDRESAAFPQFYYDLEIQPLDLTGDPADDTSELRVTLTLKRNEGTDPKAVAFVFETVFLLRPF